MHQLFITPVSSSANPRYKQLQLLLEKSRERRKQGLAVIEGLREISLALQSGFVPESVFFSSVITPQADLLDLGSWPDALPFTDLSETLFSKVAYRDKVPNALMVAKVPESGLAFFPKHGNPIVIIEGVEKPGNLGAIFRSADASGIGGVIVCDPAADLYHPNVIRSSVGCVFTVPHAVADSVETISWLKKEGYQLITTFMDKPGEWTTMDMSGAFAVAMGTEAEGLSAVWNLPEAMNLRIPMHGKIDSLNVSNAAAVIMYEIRRQQSQKPL